MSNCPKCFTIEQYSILLDFLRILPTFITAITAFCAYQIGKKYFNKGLSNSFQVERLKRFYDLHNSISSDFFDLEQNVNKFFDNILESGEGEITLAEISAIKDELQKKLKKGFYIEQFVDFHKDFIYFYNKWFIDNEDLDIFIVPNSTKKKNTAEVIKKEVQSDIILLKKKLSEIEKSKSQEISSLHI